MTIIKTMAHAIRFQLAPAALTGMWTEKENIAEDMKAERFARAALRSVKPSDISDGMVEAFGESFAFDETGKDEDLNEAYRRAIAAAIAKGGE